MAAPEASDLSTLSFQELDELVKRATEFRDKKRAEEEHNLRVEFAAKARALGCDPATFFAAETKRGGRGTSPLPPKYVNPDTGETWSGKGRGEPEWLKGKEKEAYISTDWKRAKGIVNSESAAVEE